LNASTDLVSRRSTVCYASYMEERGNYRRKYTDDDLRRAAAKSISFAGVIRELGFPLTGNMNKQLKQKMIAANIDFSHFTGQAHNKGKTSTKRKPADYYLVVLPEGSNRPSAEFLRRSMLEKSVEYVCLPCGNDETWNGISLTLEVDHIDGNWLNNTLENLRFLCPNCHSQQVTNKPWKTVKTRLNSRWA
jgi:predicted RNA-binding Zn-ribbon protein involved in translation (DUF1610 family)